MQHDVLVIAHLHPFAPTERFEKYYPENTTVLHVIDDLGHNQLGRQIVLIDGEKIAPAAYAETKIRAGQNVVVKMVPAGDNVNDVRNNGNKISGWGAGIAALGILLAFINPALGLGVFLVGWATVGVGSLFLGVANVFEKALSGVGKKPDGTVTTDLPYIRGGRNQIAPWGKVPVVLGKHLVVPYYAARPYTSMDGTDGANQYLYQLFCVGYGPLRISNIKIGESMLATNTAGVRNGAVAIDGIFPNVEIQIYQDGTAPSLFPTIVIEDQLQIELLYPYGGSAAENWRTTAPNTEMIGVDITLPTGLYQTDNGGNKYDRSVSFEARYRAVGSGTAWASCTLINTFSLTKKETKTLRYTAAVAVPKGQYEVGLKRLDEEPQYPNGQASSGYWTALRSVQSEAPAVSAHRSKFVFIAVKIKASAELKNIIDQLNCIAEIEAPAYDGSGSGTAEWVNGFTRNPAAMFLYCLRGTPNPKPIPDALIDWPRLESWYTLCASKGWTCDAVITEGSRMREILQLVAQTGRASLTLRDGKYSVVVDEPKTTIIQHFTPRNIKNFSWSKSFDELPQALKVNTISADDGYAPNERVVLDDGITEGPTTVYRQLDLWGVTSADLAWKHGRYRIALAKLRPEVYAFETDPEGIVCEPGDLILLSHDAIAVGQVSGRIKSYTTNMSGQLETVTLDELVTMDPSVDPPNPFDEEIDCGEYDGGAEDETIDCGTHDANPAAETIDCGTYSAYYGIRIRSTSDNSSLFSALEYVYGSSSVVTLMPPVDPPITIAEGDLFTFGMVNVETLRCIVAGVEAMDDMSMKIYAVDEAPGVHTADSGTIPDYESKVSRPPEFSAVGFINAYEDPTDYEALNAQEQIALMSSDGIVTPQEKKYIKQSWDEIAGNGSTTGSYWATRYAAVNLNISVTQIDAAYIALREYLFTTPGVIDPAYFGNNIVVDSSAFSAVWAGYTKSQAATQSAISGYQLAGEIVLLDCGEYSTEFTADESAGLDCGEYDNPKEGEIDCGTWSAIEPTQTIDCDLFDGSSPDESINLDCGSYSLTSDFFIPPDILIDCGIFLE